MKLSVLCFSSLVLGAVPAFSAQLYTIQKINPLPGDTIVGVNGINASGQVVGYSSLSSGYIVDHAFIYTNGSVTPINTLPLGSDATGINNAGQVVGYVYDPSNDASTAFTYSNGTLTTLSNFPGYSGGAAYGINNQGVIVGTDFAETQRTTFLYDGHSLTDLGFSGFITGINDSSQISGYGGSSSFGSASGFFYNGQIVISIPELPGDTGGTDALALNNSGQVVGNSISHPGIGSGHGLSHAMLYDNGTVKALNTLPSAGPYDESGAFAINNRGEAVGYVNGQASLFVNGVVVGLNTQLLGGSGWSLGLASAINDAGQIAGAGTFQGRETAFLLTPASVPEPATAALVALSGALIILFRRAKI